MVEPQQKLFGAGCEFAESLAHRRMVLADGVAARLRPIEAQPAFIGPMVVDRVPVGAALFLSLGRGAVMMPSPHDVVKPERSHVVYHRFM